MNIETFRAYCIAKKGVEETFPFDQDTLVFKVMGKMFALAPLSRIPSQVNLKCDPERAISLREQHEDVIFSGYHMSKKHWNTLYIELVAPSLLEELIDHSYALVVANMTKKMQEQLANL